MDPLPDALKSARSALGLSQRETAKRLGTSQSAYSRFENGKDRPAPSTLDKLIVVLGLDPVETRKDYWRARLPGYIDFEVRT